MNIHDMQRLEIGGNVFELIEFSLARFLPDGRHIAGQYGVNVAKVREVVSMPKINPLASRIPAVEGLFELRGIPIPAINLARALGDRTAPCNANQQIVVTEFSQKRAGFIVDQTHRIRRIPWDKVLPPSADHQSSITGMTLVENNEFLFILDLEKVLNEIEGASLGPEHTSSTRHAAASPIGQPTGPVVMLAEDSHLILTNVKQSLQRAGYRTVEAANGKAALDVLLGNVDAPPNDKIQLVVSDVEMPQMDGLTLTRRIKENALLQAIPVILHTSLSGNANEEAGLSVGADAYVVKNDIPSLLNTISARIGPGSSISQAA